MENLTPNFLPHVDNLWLTSISLSYYVKGLFTENKAMCDTTDKIGAGHEIWNRNCSQLFARGMNLNWPIRAQSERCSSRFQTAGDVEHGSHLFMLPYGWILFEFSMTKNGLVIILEVLYE